MKKLMVATMLVLGSFAATAARAETIDLADYFPGRLAQTHTLRATDGRHYRFEGDVVNGLWSRSVDPGCTDYQVWAPDGMYYLGWVCPGEVHWSVPPEHIAPRHWDTASPWMTTYTSMRANRTPAGDTLTYSTVTITLQATSANGESLIYASYVSVSAAGVTDQEHWWLSPCIPVRGGGCAPGIRGYMTIGGGVVTGTGEFVEWVPK
jgi:hypothetical protein